MTFLQYKCFLCALVLLPAVVLVPRAARATSEACQPFAIRGSNVVDGETLVSRDVNLVVAFTACGSRADVGLLRDGKPVESEIAYGLEPLRGGGWANVKPRALLEAFTVYTLNVVSDLGSSTIAFTTGSDLAILNSTRPWIQVVSSRFTSHADGLGRANSKFEVELRPPSLVSGGVFLLGHATANGPIDFSVPLLTFDRGQAVIRREVDVLIHAHEQICFSAVYQDEAGRKSEAADSTCATIAGEPPATNEGDNGCSTSPHPYNSHGHGASWGIVAAGIIFIFARRGRHPISRGGQSPRSA